MSDQATRVMADQTIRPTLDDLEVEARARGEDYFEFLERWAIARRRDA